MSRRTSASEKVAKAQYMLAQATKLLAEATSQLEAEAAAPSMRPITEEELAAMRVRFRRLGRKC